MRYTVIDFETTGLDPLHDEVIEYAAVRVHDGEIGLYITSLCRPSQMISPKITQITGITNEMTRNCHPFADHLHALLGFIGNDTIVAHNAPFDMGFLDAYCRHEGVRFAPSVLCTLAQSRLKYKHLPNHKLQTVAEYVNAASGSYHRALGDAMATAGILLKLLSK